MIPNRRFSTSTICRPAARASSAVLRLMWSSRSGTDMKFNRSNTGPSTPDGRTCSNRTTVPPGFTTRRNSESAFCGDATEQNTKVASAVSNESRSNGSCSAQLRTKLMPAGRLLLRDLSQCRRRLRADEHFWATRQSPVDAGLRGTSDRADAWRRRSAVQRRRSGIARPSLIAPS